MPPEGRRGRYLSGLATGYLVTAANIAVGLWLTPFILGYLDGEAYGVFALGSSLVVWLTFLDLGTSAGLRVHMAQRSSSCGAEERNRLISTTFFSQLGVAAFALAAGCALAFLFPSFFGVSPLHQDEALRFALLLVAGTALAIATGTFSAVLVAHQLIAVDNLIRLILVFLRLGLTVLFLVNGWGLVSLALANLAATAATSALAVVRCRRLLPDLALSPRLFSRPVLSELLGLGVWFSLGSVAGLLIEGVDNAVAAKALALTAVPTLVLTGRLYRLSQGVLGQVSDTARPMLAQLFGEGRRERAGEVYREIFTLGNGLSLVLAFSILAGNAKFVEAWVGAANYGGWALDAALAAGLVVNSWVLPNRAFLSSAKVVRPQTLARLAEGALNLALSIALTLRFGLIGVALSTVIACLATSFWYLPRLTGRVLGEGSSRDFAARTGRLALLAAALLPLCLLARAAAGPLPGFLGAAAAGGGTFLAGLAAMWLFFLPPEVKAHARALVAKR